MSEYRTREALQALINAVETERDTRERHFAGPRKLDSEWKAARKEVGVQLLIARSALLMDERATQGASHD